MTTAESTTVSHLVDTFVKLCAIPSPSYHEQACADWVRGYLEALGLEVEEDTAAADIPAGCNNLLARIPATVEGTPIFLCAHLDTVTLEDDVVPVIDESGRITNANEAILGGDNKAAVAVMLELAREIVSEQIPHAGIELLFTPCEEVGLVGAKHFDVSRLQAKFGFVYDHADEIGKVVAQAPTQISLRATFTGRASHSGIAPEAGRSAIRAAADALTAMPHGRIDEQTTANVGLIEGGTAVNIVPERCTLRGEVRSLDHERVTAVAQEIVEAFTDAATRHGVDVDIDATQEYRSYQFTESSPPMKLAVAALSAAGFQPQLVPCGGGSDANVFNLNGMPCVNMCNAMREIHTTDEYVLIEDLEAMLRVSHELIRLARS
jgi:tripeptide aminopeptidase